MSDKILGHNYIGGQRSGQGDVALHSVDAATGALFETPFLTATEHEVAAAVDAAEKAYPLYRAVPAEQRALFLEAIADELLDAVAEETVWDVHDRLSFPLPVTIICEIFGIPTDDIDQFKIWSDASVAALSSQNPEHYEAELARMQAYVLERLRESRAGRDDGSLLSRITRARRDGVPVTDEEAVRLVLQLFVAGNETTTSLITNFVWRMLAADGLWADFCAGRVDVDRAINESLRFDPPLLGLFRTTAVDVDLGGTVIPANTKVLTHYGAANRDPSAFRDPDVFDVGRSGRKVLSFGLGIHVCLGRELALLEARVALLGLARRFPHLELVDDGERIGPFLFWGRRHLPVRNCA